MTSQLIELGFNSFIIKNREKLEVLKQLPVSQQNIHMIVNSIDIETPNKSIKKIISDKYKLDIDIDFLNTWEILNEFSFLKSSKNYNIVTIGNNSEQYLSAIKIFRDSNKDLYCNIKITGEKETLEKDDILCSDKNDIMNLNGKINVKNSKMIKIFKKEYINTTKDIFKKKKNANFIFCCGIEPIKYYEEQSTNEILLGEILTGVFILEETGSMVIKIYDIFTAFTIKIIMLLNLLFKEVHITKPTSSYDYTSEKFIICVDYKENKEIIKLLQSILEKIDKIKSDLYLNDILSDLEINQDIKNEIININKKLINHEYITINKMYEFILSKNYFGVQYHEYLDIQTKNVNLWINRYLK
jgi:23S rRNA U2552 (ribose-2'-O)-methylase RlmE/FtsJ